MAAMASTWQASSVRPRATSDISNSGTNSRNVGKACGIHADVEYKLSETVSFKSITAYRGTTQNYDLDLTDQPVPLYVLYTDNDSRQFTEEFQLSGTLLNDKLDFVAGLFYFNERSECDHW